MERLARVQQAAGKTEDSERSLPWSSAEAQSWAPELLEEPGRERKAKQNRYILYLKYKQV